MLRELLNTLQAAVAEKVPKKVPKKSEMAVLQLLAEDPRLTRGEIARRVGLSDSGVKRILANLKASGLIQRQGSTKSGQWIVNN